MRLTLEASNMRRDQLLRHSENAGYANSTNIAAFGLNIVCGFIGYLWRN
jgi:hypothetical protein